VQISSGTVTVSDSRAVNLLTLSGGTLNGSGTLDVAGLLTWSGTTINGTGVLNANGGLSLTSSVSLEWRLVKPGYRRFLPLRLAHQLMCK
jgi:hypothetical protein